MTTKNFALSLSLLAGACALTMPAVSHAGTVGYYNACPARSGDITAVVTNAGHTKVDIATLDAPSLAGLSALVITSCSSAFPSNPALNTAVSNGMGLVFERLLDSFSIDTTALPGSNNFGTTRVQARGVANDNVNIAAGAPIATGPGGTLTDSSLDYVSGNSYYNMVFFFSSSALPAGAIPFLTTPDPSQVGSFGYTSGAGRVVYSDSQFTIALPGGNGGFNAPLPNWAGAGATFLTNAIAWTTGDRVSTTCSSEGYRGTQLTWCKNICENGLSGQVLDTWIHRWINRYRDLPYCAAETPNNPG